MSSQYTFRKLLGLMVLGVCGTGLLMFTHDAMAEAPAQAKAGGEAAAHAQSDVAGAFEGKAVHSKRYGTVVINRGQGMGWGWSRTDDQRVGGNSSASISLVHPGANGSKGALKVTGELKSGFISPWAGVAWFPGSHPMQPADLSGKKALVFWAKGKPGSYSIMVMTKSPRSIPQYDSFTLTKQWKKYTIPLATSFVGADWKKVYFIAFSAGAFGKFHFELDDVQLQ